MTATTTDWGKLASSSPIDRAAGLASIFGYSANRNTTEEEIILKAQREISPATRKHPEFINFIGRRLGTMTIVAYLGPRSPFRDPGRGTETGNTQARWLGRCHCGRYRAIRTGAVKRGTVTLCDACDYAEYLKRSSKKSEVA